MKKPDIEILAERAEGNYNAVYIDGELFCLCHTDIKSDSVRSLIESLSMVWEELESKEDWGEDLSPSQIEQIYNTLTKAGVQI